MNRIQVAFFLRPPTFTRPQSCYRVIRRLGSRNTSTIPTSPVPRQEFNASYKDPAEERLVSIQLSRLPVVLSEQYECCITLSCMQDDFSRSDDLIHGIDYAKLRQDVLGSLKTREMSRDPIVFVYKIAQHCLEKYDSVVDIDVFLASIASQLRPKPRRSSHLTYQLKAGKVRNKIPMLMIASSGHFVNAKIGVMEGERDSPQPLRLSCKFQFQMNGIRENTSIEEWSSMAIRQTERSIQQALAYVQHSSCRTLEALVSKVVDISTETDISNVAKLGLHTLQSVIVSINKRRIFQDGTLPSVKITRRVDGFRSSNLFKDGYPRHYRIHRAFIAIGSNVGDRLSMIEEACKIMDSEAIKVVRTSSLYETKAMYVVDQDQFLNGVCQIETHLSPSELLEKLKAIEKAMGREKTIDKGPRNIDLDIALYDDIVYESQELTIPHASMFEREFVLRPLCDLISQEGPPLAKETRFSIQEGSQEIGPRLSSWSYHNRLDSLAPSASPMSSITPLSSRLPFITAQSPTRDTSIMAVVNLTPDSFSDGGKHDPADQESLSETMRSHISNGATIIDIGGQSTRPHAESVAASEELDRVLPAVKAIRSLPQGQDVCISVDTYRAQVAEAAIAAGADLINDVSAGALDEDMLKTVAKLGCTICLMHMRGTPDTMNSLTDYPEGLIPIIGAELLARVQAAEKAGIRRWRIILDPGIGFAKTAAQNLDILRNLDALRNMEGLQGLPWLVGASRKGFIGKITGVEAPAQRSWGTAAAVTAAVQNGADIVRVHDVAEMAKVVKMADAIWRSGDL